MWTNIADVGFYWVADQMVSEAGILSAAALFLLGLLLIVSCIVTISLPFFFPIFYFLFFVGDDRVGVVEVLTVLVGLDFSFLSTSRRTRKAVLKNKINSRGRHIEERVVVYLTGRRSFRG